MTDSKKCGGCTYLNVMHKGDSCADQGVKPEDEACEKWRSKAADFVALDRLVARVKSKMRHNDWLPSDPTQAYVVCVAQGPWVWARRKQITAAALKEAKAAGDMSKLPAVAAFPFDWQKGLIKNLCKYLNKRKLTMREFMKEVLEHAKTHGTNQARQKFYDACGAPTGPKVLSLFVRDYLRLASFPIDRHVRRMIEKHNLPVHESALVTLCEERKYDPVAVAIGTVRVGSNGAIG